MSFTLLLLLFLLPSLLDFISFLLNRYACLIIREKDVIFIASYPFFPSLAYVIQHFLNSFLAVVILYV